MTSDLPKISFSVLGTAKKYEKRNGLRDNDYERYRKYCARRLRRLRVALNITNKQDGKETKITSIEPEQISDERYFMLYLFNAERAWSYALELKSKDPRGARQFSRYLYRASKAANWSEKLVQLCQSRGDDRTALDASGYYHWMKGMDTFENQNFEEALLHFSLSKHIFEGLQNVGGDIEEHDIYRDHITNEIEPRLAHCRQVTGIQDVTAQHESQFSSIAKQIDGLQSVAGSEITKPEMYEGQWRGQSFVIHSAKIRALLVKSQDWKQQVDKHSGGQKIDVLDKIVECYNEAQRLVEQEKAYATDTDEGKLQVQLLDSFVRFLRLRALQQRHEEASHLMERKLHGIEGQHKSRKRRHRKVESPEQAASQYNILVQALSDLEELPGVDDFPEIVDEVDYKLPAYTALKFLYLGLCFQNQEQWKKAFALFSKAKDQAQEASEYETNELTNKIKNRTRSAMMFAHAQTLLNDELEENISSSQEDILSNMHRFHVDTSEKPKLAVFPPSFQTVPCKPVFFDIALSEMTHPDLKPKYEKKKGWFFGWG
eukprot:gb/GECH01000006.1/.p1 GENE.gb/GECH01000006.1/~~gb/GECH01000006.1/.p1  ORF type:complete len:544 (+),score=134.81 gb/GECH01000006.1/:1-1632(+)